MELAVKLHVYCRENGRPYRIRYAADAVCWTQVPSRLGDLCGSGAGGTSACSRA